MTQRTRRYLACLVFACAATPAFAQISFTAAVGLALKSNPKVLMAQAEVDKARAALAQLKDAYIPSVVGGTGIGPPSYGFPLGQPTLFSITSQSLVFSYSQRDYIRAARTAIEAATLTLKDIREGVAEDTAVSYLAFSRDLERQAALREQQGYADRLVSIVQQRTDAGHDTAIDLTTARLSAAQIHLALLRADDETDTDRAHLARLIGLPPQGLSTSSRTVPPFPQPVAEFSSAAPATSPAVLSAYANAHAKQETAFADTRYLGRPQVFFAGQYNRFATFNNYQAYYLHFQQNNAAVGVQLNIPLFDRQHGAKARESAAEAARSLHEADMVRDQFFDTQARARHTAAELSARADIANLDQQLAQQQLDVLLVQLKSGSGNLSGPQMTPKDEQNSRIAEREKFLAVLNARFDAAQAQIDLMRQSGDLENWIAAQLPSAP
ncbi:MAG: TolC family protein [Acidobacteriota bacterium]|nr:TolC family protein [Acidobacteriota bacterium]